MNAPVYYIECGCCGHFHTPEFFGDCRGDTTRFTFEQLDAKHGGIDGWAFESLGEQLEEEAAQ